MRNRIYGRDINEETRKRALQIGTLALLLLLLLLFLSLQGNKGLMNSSISGGSSHGTPGVSDHRGEARNDLPAAGMGDRSARAERYPATDDMPRPGGFSVQLQEADANGINFTVTAEPGGIPQAFSTSNPGAGTSPGDLPGISDDPEGGIFQIGKEGGPSPVPLFDGGTTPPGSGIPGDPENPGPGGFPGGTPWPDTTLIPPEIIIGGGSPPIDTGISPATLPSTTAVPEPGTLALLGSGLAGVAARRWTKKSRKKSRSHPEER